MWQVVLSCFWSVRWTDDSEKFCLLRRRLAADLRRRNVRLIGHMPLSTMRLIGVDPTSLNVQAGN